MYTVRLIRSFVKGAKPKLQILDDTGKVVADVLGLEQANDLKAQLDQAVDALRNAFV